MRCATSPARSRAFRSSRASIMSKKIAEGIDALVLDVKTRRRRLHEDRGRRARARRVAGGDRQRAGVQHRSAASRAMDAPLGRAVGNALEIIECIETLKGGGPRDSRQLSVELAARMLVLGGVAPTAGRAPSTGPRGARLGGRRSRSSGGSSSTRAAIPASSTTMRGCRRPRTRIVTAPRGGFVARLAPSGRARRGGARRRPRPLDAAVDPAVGIMSSRRRRRGVTPAIRC